MCVLCIQATEFAKIMVPLFKQVAKCLNSSHFQVITKSHYRNPVEQQPTLPNLSLAFVVVCSACVVLTVYTCLHVSTFCANDQ